MNRFFIFFTILLFLFSCSSESKREKEIAAIPMEFKTERFDRKFAEAVPEDLAGLKKDFPYLFPQQYPDSVWTAKMQDTIQIEINEEVDKVFGDFSKQQAEIKKLFQHLKYYFPEFTPPTVVTITSEVDYKNNIIAADTLLLIGLDNFLGSEHHFYQEMQQYLSKNFTSQQIAPEIANAYAEQLIPPPADRTFLSAVAYYGKILYLKELLLSGFPENEIIGYTQDELDWAKENESEIWRYFVEKELLFSTDPQLVPRFISPAPFSKFYLELDNESPGRLGQYIGWQIAKAYMKNNTVSVKQLLAVRAEDLFRQSKFKPRK